MMNEDEKSDPAIVAVKLANNAERSATERVEPWAGTEGNADARNTVRAQNREDVSQSLDGAREAAQQRKKEKLTALPHHVNVDALRDAFYAHPIGDRRIVRLIQNWPKAGVLENGSVTVSGRGTGQGATISPLLAEVCLHYVFDFWVERWRRREAHGDMNILRYADDLSGDSERGADARRFLEEMPLRFEVLGLSLHPEKRRLIEFGRFAPRNRKRLGLGKAETFNFLNFTHICARAREGGFLLKRKNRSDRVRAKLRQVKDGLERQMHLDIPKQREWLCSGRQRLDARRVSRIRSR